MTSFETLLGVDPNDPALLRAETQATADREMLRQLVRMRKERGLTQAAVGERLGISQAAVAGFEAHDSNPTLATIRRYANVVEALVTYSVTPDERSTSVVVPLRSHFSPSKARPMKAMSTILSVAV